MTVINKDVPSKKNLLGQFFTPLEVAEFCVSKINTNAELIIEPSCGEGVFLDLLKKKYPDRLIYGYELDPEMASHYQGIVPVQVNNFYDFISPIVPNSIAFIGNPPYRSPAYSLTTHKPLVNWLRNKYKVEGVREESVLFILYTFYISELLGIPCEAHYILPRAIFQNNSKVFTKFIDFLNINFGVRAVWDLAKEFDSVDRNIVFVSFSSGTKNETILLNDESVLTDSWLGGGKGIIPFQKIFKKTYLGSVPCESIFLSCAKEPKEHFANRLLRLFSCSKKLSGNEILEYLAFEGKPHLRALKSGNPDKIKVVSEYVENIKELSGFSLSLFSDLDNYKPIRHREEERWYFRHNFLKFGDFVYQLNPKPCPSITFPGNPSYSSKDYFGYVSYDINRNSGPGAQRLVPIENVEDNLTDWFKNYWSENAKLPYEKVLDYLQWIGQSEWYRLTKKANERFYFGIPEEYNGDWYEESTNSWRRN